MAKKILIIKLGALGDFVLALPAFAAIRRHHPGARITLLTTRPFAELAKASPYFDEIQIDDKPKLNPIRWLALAARLNAGKFTRVYDLQTSGRSNFYYRLFLKKPEWSGIARGCSHPDPTPDRAAVHSFDLRVNQLRAAGIEKVPPGDLSWLTQGDRQKIPEKSVLFVPGGAAHRPEKRWPALTYAGLAARLAARGYTPVVIGNTAEQNAARLIAAAAPQTIDLTCHTTLFDIADLARRAVATIGNDTGPHTFDRRFVSDVPHWFCFPTLPIRRIPARLELR